MDTRRIWILRDTVLRYGTWDGGYCYYYYLLLYYYGMGKRWSVLFCFVLFLSSILYVLWWWAHRGYVGIPHQLLNPTEGLFVWDCFTTWDSMVRMI